MVAVNVAAGHAQSACKAMKYEVGLGLLDLAPISTRTISGRVVDPEGVPVPGNVMCIGLFDDSGKTLVATADADRVGRFRSKAIPPGLYRIVVRVAGFWSPRVRVKVVRWPAGGILKSHKLTIRLVLPRIQPACRDGAVTDLSLATISATYMPPFGSFGC
jgi:hypothetical protein